MTMPPQNPPVALISETIDDAAVVRSRPTADPAPTVLPRHGLGGAQRDPAARRPALPPGFSYGSLRGTPPYVQGYAWSASTIDPARPEALQTSAAAVESWIDEQPALVA